MHLTPQVPEDRLDRIRGRAKAASAKPVPAKVQAYLRGESTREARASKSRNGGKEERRQFGRFPLRSEIIVRRIGGFNFQVAVTDISSGGCRVELVEPCEVGDSVITRLPDLEPLGSRVCWGQGTTTGIQFLTTIHPAVLDTLVARLPAVEPTAA